MTERTFDYYNPEHAERREDRQNQERHLESYEDFDVSITSFIHPADMPEVIESLPDDIKETFKQFYDATKIYLFCRPLFSENYMPDIAGIPFLFSTPSGVASNLYGTEYKNKIAVLRFPNFPSMVGAYIPSISGTLGDEAGAYCKKQTAWNVGMRADT